MALNRDAVFQALFDLITNDPRAAIFTMTRRFLRSVDATKLEQMPALYTFQLPETREHKGTGLPPKRTLRCVYVVYYGTSNPDEGEPSPLPATLLNTAADIIDDIVSNPGNPGNVQTLGGLVQHVYIEPDIKPYEGLLQQKSVIVFALGILVP